MRSRSAPPTLLAGVALAAVLGLLATGCGDDAGTPVDGDPFGAVTWELTAGTVDGGALELVPSAPVTLTVTDGEVRGTSACNTYFGPISVDGGSVSIEAPAVTEMACLDEAVMALERAYLDALVRVDAAVRDGEELVLTGDGVELRFTARAEVPDASLAGTDWVLDTMLEGETASSVIAGGEDAALRIEDDGTLTGSDGCNTFGGMAEVVDGRLQVAELVSTEIACADLEPQTSLVLDVLTGSPTISIDGAGLTLLLDDGRGLIYRAS